MFKEMCLLRMFEFVRNPIESNIFYVFYVGHSIVTDRNDWRSGVSFPMYTADRHQPVRY